MMKFGVEFTADVGALEEMVAFGVEILIAEGAEKVSGVGPNVEADASVEVETEEIIWLPVLVVTRESCRKCILYTSSSK